MQEVLAGRPTEQTQIQLQNLAKKTDDILKSARKQVIEEKLTEKDLAYLSERIFALNRVASDHAQRHGDLTYLRVEIGQKPVGMAHTGIDLIVQGLLDTALYKTGMNWQGPFESNIAELYLERRLGYREEGSRTETFYLAGKTKAFLPHAPLQPTATAPQR